MRRRKTLIKICGLTTEQDIENVNRYQPDLVGFILFFPKSKRYLPLDVARKLKDHLCSGIKSVAVVVSPDVEQVRQIMKAGFDYIQIHGSLREDVYDFLEIPVFRAFNVKDIDTFEEIKQKEKIAGYIFDASEPGSGKTFDWALLDSLERDDKLFFLAGGINETNVKEAMERVQPDGIDVSSAVEREDTPGKDPEKIKKIIRMVRYE
ncbi:MAG: phosphoribosylanthranilate isomerase [Eubacteriales bacterium]|nr:phosphoribosylanthranilate isomerase [Eubacteriales bacterium]